MCQNIAWSCSRFSSWLPTTSTLNWRARSNHICKNHAYTNAVTHEFHGTRIPRCRRFILLSDWKDEPAERLKYRNGNIKWNQSDGFRFVLLSVAALFLRYHLYLLRFAYKFTDDSTFERFSSFCCRIFSMDIHYKQIKKNTSSPPSLPSIISIVNRKSNQM